MSTKKVKKEQAAPAEELLRIRSVSVKGLFGIYDHEIRLSDSDPVTILHGPNGVGKTAVLRLLSAMFLGNYYEFGRYQFDSFAVTLSDGQIMRVEPAKTVSKRDDRSVNLVQVSSSGEATAREVAIESGEFIEYVARQIADLPLVTYSGENRFQDRQSNEELTASQVFHKYFAGTSAHRKTGPVQAAEPPEWRSLRERIRVHLVETQRLFKPSVAFSNRYGWREPAMVATVGSYAGDLSQRIQSNLAYFGAQAQQLDQSFPLRLLKVSAQSELLPPVDKLRTSLEAIAKMTSEFQAIGLLDGQEGNPLHGQNVDALFVGQQPVMALYVADTETKLSALKDLALRLRIFVDKVNAKFRHKRICIVREKGFVAVGDDAKQLSADALSSGEQHELVMLYDLLFKVRAGTLVLIDEPELSLHVGWQEQFLPDLLDIAATAGFDAMVATHSPFIVGDRRDLMVALGGAEAG